MIWYFRCPKCGKEESSNGTNFCGPCEQQYQEEMIESVWQSPCQIKSCENRVQFSSEQDRVSCEINGTALCDAHLDLL